MTPNPTTGTTLRKLSRERDGRPAAPVRIAHLGPGNFFRAHQAWYTEHAPDAIRRYRGAVTETAGFGRTSGFIDDTRAFCSIPARHDMSRRLDCGYLAELVATHRLDEDEALETAHDLVAVNPKAAFKL